MYEYDWISRLIMRILVRIVTGGVVVLVVVLFLFVLIVRNRARHINRINRFRNRDRVRCRGTRIIACIITYY